MLMRLYPLQTLCVTLMSISLLAGCGGDETTEQNKPDGETTGQSNASENAQDPHDVPLTEEEIAALKDATEKYEDALAHIKDYQKTIETETTGGEPAKAHRALDNLDVVLERLPEAAQNSNVPKEKWQEVNETGQKLRDLFNQVHANIDAGKAPDYKSVAEEIVQGIETLDSIKPAETE